MADFTKNEGAFIQYQMRLKLKTQLLNLASLTAREVMSLLFELRKVSSNSEYTRMVREYLPIIMENSGENSALITANYYQESRAINALTAGTAIAIGSTFTAKPDSYLRDTNATAQLLDKKMSGVTYNFNKLWSPELVYDLEPIKNISMLSEESIENIITPEKVIASNMNPKRKEKLLSLLSEDVVDEKIPNSVIQASMNPERKEEILSIISEESGKPLVPENIMNAKISPQKRKEILSTLNPDGTISGFVTGKREITSREQLEKPILELAQRAPLDYSYLEIEQVMKDDPHAGESVKRTTTSGSCTFCKHMATFVGSEGWAKDKFHNGCGCTPGASFAYEADYQPKWSGDYEEEYYKVQDELIAEAKFFEKKKIPTKRFSESQGKEVKSMKTVWIDTRTGKEGVPPKTNSRAVVAKISARSRK